MGITFAVLSAVPAQEQAPTFRTGTRLVEVSVSVSDKQGNPVTRLAKDDFTILDKGKPREIAFFKFEGADQPSRPRPLSPGLFTNRTEALSGPTRNIAAIVLDSLNTQPKDKIVVRAQALRYLRALAPEMRVAVYHIGAQVKVIHDFTDDMDSLRERLAKFSVGIPLQGTVDITQSVIEAERIIAANPDNPEIERMLRAQIEADQQANAVARRNRVEMTLASLEAIGRHLSGIPGRKNLIWISGGISMVSITGAWGFGTRGNIESFETKITAASRRLAQQGVALYIVDAKGLEGPAAFDAGASGQVPTRGRGRFERNVEADTVSNDNKSALNTMASITGGRFMFDTNDMLQGFRHAMNDLKGTYTLAFYAGEEPGEKWHSLKVRVKGSGLKVRHREGYIAEQVAAAAPGWSDDNWRAAIANPLGSSAVRMTARCEQEAGEVSLQLWIDPASISFGEKDGVSHAEVEINVTGISPDGVAHPHFETGRLSLNRQQMNLAQQQGIPYERRWKPAPGVAAVRVIVRDRSTGSYGSLDIPLKSVPKRPAAD